MRGTSNFIVEGKGFGQIEFKPEVISRLNQRIDQLMFFKNFDPETIHSLFNQTFLSNSYFLRIPNDMPLMVKLKKDLGLMSKAEFSRKAHYQNLGRTRDDFPFKVTFTFNSSKIENNFGIIMTVRSEPTINFKIAQLGIKPEITDLEYKNIIDLNKDFIVEIITAIGFRIIEKPNVIEDSNNLKNVITLTPTLFKIPDKPIRKNCVSVMMPIKKEFADVHEIIKKACSNVNMPCYRADDFWKDSTIIQDIFELIYRSSVVIADFSGKNSNVFYEAGIAHTLGKDVIPITQSLNDIPFDLQPHRILTYLKNNEGLEKLEKKS